MLHCTTAPGSSTRWRVAWEVPASGMHDVDPSTVQLSVSAPAAGTGAFSGCHAFATCASDGVVNVHSMDRRAHLLQLRVGTPLTCCDFLPCGKLLAAGSSDGKTMKHSIKSRASRCCAPPGVASLAMLCSPNAMLALMRVDSTRVLAQCYAHPMLCSP